MVTLKEFITILNVTDQFRVYAPNRDCLAYESYDSIHTGAALFEPPLSKARYWKHKYLRVKRDPKYPWKRYLDKETKKFLSKYGDYAVFSVEMGHTMPYNYTYDTKTRELIDNKYIKDPIYGDSVPCLSLFIIQKDVYLKDYSDEALKKEEAKYRATIRNSKK